MGARSPRHPSLLKSGKLLYLSSSFLVPQISSASWWGTLTSQKPRLPSPTTGGCEWGGVGCSGLLRSGFAPGAGSGWRRSWVLSRAPGEPEHAPSSAPGRGAGGRRALGYPGSVWTSPQVLGPDPAPRCAAGTPALCAPAPAAQLLRMTSSHLPPPGPHLPEG